MEGQETAERYTNRVSSFRSISVKVQYIVPVGICPCGEDSFLAFPPLVLLQTNVIDEVYGLINWDNPCKRRDRLFILAEILDVTQGGCLKTQVMYRANLSFSQLNEYLDLLVSMKLVGLITQSDKTIYKITSRGLQYLRNYREIIELLQNGNGKSDIKGGPPIYWIRKTS